ncbi:MAG: NAD(P)-dependent alcohol dehydrogenase [Pseudomonadota bacterium]
MKVMQIEGAWGTGNIKPATRPDPTAGPGAVVIDIEAVSINPRDKVMTEGGYGRRGGSLPLVPLCDGAGRVSQIGEGVTGFALGDLVIPAYSRTWLSGTFRSESFSGAHGGPLDGMMQEKIAIPAQAVVKAPKHLSAREAATLPCAAVTAWNALIVQGGVQPGQSVLLQGTGGVSLFALQIAKMLGATVVITSSSDEKLDQARALGADHTINYRTEPEWHEAARERLGGQLLDHIIEIGGAETFAKSLRAIRPSGTISLIGILGGALPSLELARVVTRNVRLQGVTVGSREMLDNLARALEANQIHPVIDETRFAFDAVGAALDRLALGKHFGKIVCQF